MNVKKRLEHVAFALGMKRQVGKSTLIAKACKDLDGVLLCANVDHAKRMKHQHMIHTASVQTNLEGYTGPFFIDHYAVEELLYSAVRKISDLERELLELKNKNQGLEHAVVDAVSTLNKVERGVL